jgi:hypothetical protein
MNIQKQLKFIHITKCAGTFIEEIGRENNIKWGKYHKEYGWWHETFISKPQKMKDKFDWFVIVRNPYTRILSEYYCQWGGINHESYKNKEHTKDEFNKFLIDKIKNRQNSYLHNIEGHHYTEQYKYIDDSCCQHIIKLEEIDVNLQPLFDMYNIKIDVKDCKKINTTVNKFKYNNFTVEDFNDELIEIINSIYKKDFELFGYEIKSII